MVVVLAEKREGENLERWVCSVSRGTPVGLLAAGPAALALPLTMVSSSARSPASSFTWNSGAVFTVQFALRTGVTDLLEPSYRL